MRPYGNNIYSKDGKRDPQTWLEAMKRIQNPEGAHQMFHRAFDRIKKVGKPFTMPEEVIAAVYYPAY